MRIQYAPENDVEGLPSKEACSLSYGELEELYTHLLIERQELVDLAKRRKEEIHALKTRLDQLTFQDSETGILNRRSFNRAYRREWRAALREQIPLGLALLKIDDLDDLAKRLGQDRIGALIREIAQSTATQLRRPRDVLARYDPDTLILMMPDTPAKGTQALLSKIQQHLENHPLVILANTQYRPIEIKATYTALTPQLYHQAKDPLIHLLEELDSPARLTQ